MNEAKLLELLQQINGALITVNVWLSAIDHNNTYNNVLRGHVTVIADMLKELETEVTKDSNTETTSLS